MLVLKLAACVLLLAGASIVLFVFFVRYGLAADGYDEEGN